MDTPKWGAEKLTGENLKVVWAEFSTLSLVVFIMNVISLSRHVRPHLELKTRPRFRPVSLSLSMAIAREVLPTGKA